MTWSVSKISRIVLVSSRANGTGLRLQIQCKILGRRNNIQVQRLQVISRTAFDHAAGRLREQLVGRAPDLDPIDLEIGLALLFAGIAVVAEIWIDRHRDARSTVSPTARADWDQLLDRVLVRLRTR